jgi:NAD(P) transhydrogenase subunit alpha
MKVGVPRESADGERRVALVPDAVKGLSAKGIDVVVESGAGEGAAIPDSAYEEAGGSVADSGAAWGADVVAKVRAPSSDEIGRLQSGRVLVGFLAPLTSPDTTRALASAGVTSFAMEAIPRITRAQSMDALSSQATVAGYKAVLMAAEELPRFLPMLTTAAGTIRPARVLVLGAGVAGLQAIATAKRLGAIVSAFDVRAAVKEQIESLGARFLEIELETDAEGAGGYAKELDEETQRRQQEMLTEAVGGSDAVITTALVPGRPAPELITTEAVHAMKPGSVIVDLAAEAGGNCKLTRAGETVVESGVKLIGPLNLPSTMPDHASQLYAKNVQNLVELMADEDGGLNLNWEDEIIAGACITRDGEIVHEGAKAAVGG